MLRVVVMSLALGLWSVTPGVAPLFSLPDLGGREVSLAALKGRVVLVNFWATWCPPCKAEMPLLISLQERFGHAGLQVLGVAMDEDGRSVVHPWVQRQQFTVDGRPQSINFPILIGTAMVADAYGPVDPLPVSVLVDRVGRIAMRVNGPLEGDAMTSAIVDALRGR